MNKLNIIIFGASGDLAAKKIFPALFSLFSRNLLPQDVKFYGFSRSEYSNDEFRTQIASTLTCRYTPDHSCESFMQNLLERCYYCQGDYGDSEAYSKLDQLMCETGNCDDQAALLFYMAVPPTLYIKIASAMKLAGLVHEDDHPHWSRVIIEKPFGRDRDSSDELTGQLATLFCENNTYRIDHYLGKEMVQNLLVLRFANQIFQPLWNRKYIHRIELLWAEDLGINERGGYFDNYGIIRDVIQNHMMQIVALLAMEEPASLDAEAIRDRKVELLRCVTPLKSDSLVVGQYCSAMFNGVRVSGYLDDPSVPDDSITPTYARMTLNVDNERWRDVPFIITAGKGLSCRKTEVKIVFKHAGSNIFCNLDGCPPLNELVLRIQPAEGLHFNIVTKKPGTKMKFISKEIDLSYNNAFAGEVIPEAYENLILDAINGDKQLFIREDELEAAWDVLTPALQELEKNKIVPKPYPFGSDGV